MMKMKAPRAIKTYPVCSRAVAGPYSFTWIESCEAIRRAEIRDDWSAINQIPRANRAVPNTTKTKLKRQRQYLTKQAPNSMIVQNKPYQGSKTLGQSKLISLVILVPQQALTGNPSNLMILETWSN